MEYGKLMSNALPKKRQGWIESESGPQVEKAIRKHLEEGGKPQKRAYPGESLGMGRVQK